MSSFLAEEDFRHVCVEPQAHHRSAGRPRVKSFTEWDWNPRGEKLSSQRNYKIGESTTTPRAPHSYYW